jgi:hypothetical protein
MYRDIEEPRLAPRKDCGQAFDGGWVEGEVFADSAKLPFPFGHQQFACGKPGHRPGLIEPGDEGAHHKALVGAFPGKIL